MGGYCRRRLNQRPDLHCNAFFCFPEMRQEDQGLGADHFQQQRATSNHLRQCLLNRPFPGLQQLDGRAGQLNYGQGAVALRRGFQQDVIDAGAGSIERILGDADVLGDLIGGLEADPVDVLG